ncbi:MAG: orotidine-5'-phosphate decarboxylase [Chloroflexi bacterium]|nr:orotidine-5'-phosphate decarboxylase [Chloroflexota bacterium]MDA1146557.1 orotidine-5'-phosphate decarboxylase [Chloroflexota bacterium]MQC82753.1 orotidine-5'-phosphate decarboxylase [Chloroflexota bacterium]
MTTTEARPSTRIAGRFRERLDGAVEANNSLLCVGLDPDPDRIPAGVSVRDFLIGVIEATSKLVCAYKPNAAFFEQYGDEGWRILREVVAAVPDHIPVLLDAKRGDVGHTAAAYASALYDWVGVDAVTLNPYLGIDALEPFLAYEDRHVFVLCRTSNPSAGDLQDMMAGDVRLYERVAELSRGWNVKGNVGLVVGATYPEEAARVRAICPDQLMLLPGVGAQQGDINAAVGAAIDANGRGVLVNASRGVLYAQPFKNGCAVGGWAEAAYDAARVLRDAINAAR